MKCYVLTTLALSLAYPAHAMDEKPNTERTTLAQEIEQLSRQIETLEKQNCASEQNLNDLRSHLAAKISEQDARTKYKESPRIYKHSQEQFCISHYASPRNVEPQHQGAPLQNMCRKKSPKGNQVATLPENYYPA